MPTYYVGAGGNDSNAGTSWAQRKLTLNGAEDIPVAAGDTVYVGPGVYRELLTIDVSGSSGSPITYIGDYTGASTDGVGGVVRITGSDNDQAAARTGCITANDKDYRVFRNFALSGHQGDAIILTNACTNWEIDKFHVLCAQNNSMIDGNVGDGIKITNSFAIAMAGYCISLTVSTPASTPNTLIENNIILGGAEYSIYILGGYDSIVHNNITVGYRGVYGGSMSGGGSVKAYNNVIVAANVAFGAGAAGELVENYNNIYSPSVARLNVSAGANSNTYITNLDTRWFFEMVNGGSMLSPFDLASYSQLVNVAGSSPPAADMRNTTIIGAAREWGPLEYDPDLDIEAGSGGGGGPIVGSRIVRAV